ncbi:hypothetical protein GYMLUDRAFT_202910 [Collybiopsis luxurians FD-317 M1]|uniref:Unplaced genomic scaffold GYMLUscaffold_39, whole genome shotgun sequence n=1 Tax=Collybiopsis luxurians FD-317 M1 TaxID=944289 RepID=A0A0D0CR99_9AGAR|nr:hypothetical protein GYMLUDRAFT_202910 [Collybiopsis luxurians FD-317 M1]
MTNSGSAFGQTFQYITDIKLHELERQREACVKYVQETLAQARAATDPVSHLDILLQRIQGWTGTGLSSLTSSDINLGNYKAFVHQARHDPSIPSAQISGWISTLEGQLDQAVTRYNYAKLFGDLLKEWLQSGDSLAVTSDSNTQTESAEPSASETKVQHRSEHDEQRDRIQELIFTPKHIDVDALTSYLHELFHSTPEATAALGILRARIRDFGESLFSEPIDESSMGPLIRSLLSRDLLSTEKAATLKSFLSNEVILSEVTSVLRMQLARLDTWEWPEEGVFVEMRRHLSGKYRAYMDNEIIQALLFQYIGMKWSIALKEAFRQVMQSKAWKSETTGTRPLLRDHIIRRRYFKVDNEAPVRRGSRWDATSGISLPGSIQARRKALQLEQFFMTQLPSSIEGTAEYDEEPDYDQGKPAVGASAQQALLRLVSTEAHLKRSLCGSCTIMRADLEWFGPSIPHDSILTVFRFFGMSDKWLTWFEKWLAAKLHFDNSPDVQVRRRGVPIAHALSVICGESILFGMDFAVNQRSQGLYVYRIYDDFWFTSHSSSICASAWAEMQKYASLVGITFNAKKTGGVCVGGELDASLPRGKVAWGFLQFDEREGRFAVDQEEVDRHIKELKRQLGKTRSVFGFVNAYNKYMEFFRRNFGQPAHCFGQVHLDEVVQTFERIQREIFVEHSGSVVEKLRSMIETRFGDAIEAKNMPAGWCFFPVSEGGLEVLNPVIQLLMMREYLVPEPDKQFKLRMDVDRNKYEQAKTDWMNGLQGDDTKEVDLDESKKMFMSFEEYILGREDRMEHWGREWKHLQELPASRTLALPPGYDMEDLSQEAIWNVSLYAEEIKACFGGLNIVESSLIPVGMLSTFRSAKVAWDS